MKMSVTLRQCTCTPICHRVHCLLTLHTLCTRTSQWHDDYYGVMRRRCGHFDDAVAMQPALFMERHDSLYDDGNAPAMHRDAARHDA